VLSGKGPQPIDPCTQFRLELAPTGALIINRPEFSSAYICHPAINCRKLLKHPAAGLRVFDLANDGSTNRASSETETATTTINSRKVNAHLDLVFMDPIPAALDLEALAEDMRRDYPLGRNQSN
jgi:hypothetical protein